LLRIIKFVRLNFNDQFDKEQVEKNNEEKSKWKIKIGNPPSPLLITFLRA